MSEKRITLIRDRLSKAFQPRSLNIIDESHKHAGHTQAGGGGHFVVEIVSDSFKDKNLMQRHRLVYGALGDVMHTEIHALSIKASTPDEQGV